MSRKRRVYTQEERAQALALVAANGGGHPAVVEAARLLGIPRETVKTWVEQHAEEVVLAARAVEQGLLPLAWEARRRALERLIATLDEAKPRDLAIIVGVLSDKIGDWTGRGATAAVDVTVQVNVPGRVSNAEEWEARAAALDGEPPF